jgi:hypothetical protein
MVTLLKTSLFDEAAFVFERSTIEIDHNDGFDQLALFNHLRRLKLDNLFGVAQTPQNGYQY